MFENWDKCRNEKSDGEGIEQGEERVLNSGKLVKRRWGGFG